MLKLKTKKLKLLILSLSGLISGFSLNAIGVFSNQLYLLIFLLSMGALLSAVSTVVTRYLVKFWISPNGQLPMYKWFTWSFISKLSIKQIAGLLGILGFSLVTYPLGIWVASYSAAMFVPLNGIIIQITGLITFPLELIALNRTVGEIQFNRLTLIGMVIVMLGVVVIIGGWTCIYYANRV